MFFARSADAMSKAFWFLEVPLVQVADLRVEPSAVRSELLDARGERVDAHLRVRDRLRLELVVRLAPAAHGLHDVLVLLDVVLLGLDGVSLARDLGRELLTQCRRHLRRELLDELGQEDEPDVEVRGFFPPPAPAGHLGQEEPGANPGGG